MKIFTACFRLSITVALAILFYVSFSLPSYADSEEEWQQIENTFKNWCESSGLPGAKFSKEGRGSRNIICEYKNLYSREVTRQGQIGLWKATSKVNKSLGDEPLEEIAINGKTSHIQKLDEGQSYHLHTEWGIYNIHAWSWFSPSAREDIINSTISLVAALGKETVQDEVVGVAIVPFMSGVAAADATEDALYALAGQLDEIDLVYTPSSSDALFETLLKIREQGKLIDVLLIAGHGSKFTPGVKFPDRPLLLQDVNHWQLRRDLILQVKNLLNIKDFTKRASSNPQKGVDLLLNYIEYLDSISDAMATDGTVFLINCSSAATPEGIKFLKNLGEALLSKRGGSIVGSKIDVKWKLVEDRWDQWAGLWHSGKMTEPGDIWFGGDWMTIPIEAKKDSQVNLSSILPEDSQGYLYYPSKVGETNQITATRGKTLISITNHKKFTKAIEEFLRDSREKHLSFQIGDAGAENLKDPLSFKDDPNFSYELIFTRGFYLVKLGTTDPNEVEQLKIGAKEIDLNLKPIVDRLLP